MNFECSNMFKRLAFLRPSAIANMKGRDEFAGISGEVCFYDFGDVMVVAATFHNLIKTPTGIFGFHIHEDGECEGDFISAGGHLGDGEHPDHAGDMPPILSAGGDAFLAFATDRVTVDEIIGKSVILHEGRDDFTTQPSGDSGARIACGIIENVKK